MPEYSEIILFCQCNATFAVSESISGGIKEDVPRLVMHHNRTGCESRTLSPQQVLGLDKRKTLLYTLCMYREDSEQHRLQEILTLCADLFDRNESLALADSVIGPAIGRFEGNSSLESVLPKVIIINSFYSTQIYDTEKVAKRTLTMDADSRLAAGDLTLIDDIRHGHGVKTKKTGKEIDFYSFATKYAALHEPTKFPIFDSLVMRLVTALNKKLGFCTHFTQTYLRNYQRYVSVIDALMAFSGLGSYKYKRFDQGLWIYGKYLYDQSSLVRSEIQVIQEMIATWQTKGNI